MISGSKNNVSVNSKPDHPPSGDPRGFARSHCPRGRGFAQLSLPEELGFRGFELEKLSTVLKEICRNFSISFKETRGSLKIRCSCAASYQFLKKTVVDFHCIFNNIDHFRPFRSFW